MPPQALDRTPVPGLAELGATIVPAELVDPDTRPAHERRVRDRPAERWGAAVAITVGAALVGIAVIYIAMAWSDLGVVVGALALIVAFSAALVFAVRGRT